MLLDGFKDAALELTAGRGVDVVVDVVGGDAFLDSLRCLAAQGRLLVVGFAAGQGIPEVKVNRLLLNNIDVRGVNWGGFAMKAGSYMQEQWAALLPLIESGVIDPPIGATYELDDLGRALQDIDERRTLGKSVVQGPLADLELHLVGRVARLLGGHLDLVLAHLREGQLAHAVASVLQDCLLPSHLAFTVAFAIASPASVTLNFTSTDLSPFHLPGLAFRVRPAKICWCQIRRRRCRAGRRGRGCPRCQILIGVVPVLGPLDGAHAPRTSWRVVFVRTACRSSSSSSKAIHRRPDGAGEIATCEASLEPGTLSSLVVPYLPQHDAVAGGIALAEGDVDTAAVARRHRDALGRWSSEPGFPLNVEMEPGTFMIGPRVG